MNRRDMLVLWIVARDARRAGKLRRREPNWNDKPMTLIGDSWVRVEASHDEIARELYRLRLTRTLLSPQAIEQIEVKALRKLRRRISPCMRELSGVGRGKAA
jgi:hypothetical protein